MPALLKLDANKTHRNANPRLSRHVSIVFRGFTLIELLVVLAVISILAVLLTGVVPKAVTSAQSTKCSSNLRQIALASLAYAADNSSILPDGKEPGGNTDTMSTAYIMRTQLGPYIPINKGHDAWFCPAQPKVIAFYYFEHSDIPRVNGTVKFSGSAGKRLATLRQPQKTILWRDRGFDPARGGDTIAEPLSPGPHNGHYIVCFADGHQEVLHEKADIMTSLRSYPGTEP